MVSTTFPRLLLEHAAKRPQAPALRAYLTKLREESYIDIKAGFRNRFWTND